MERDLYLEQLASFQQRLTALLASVAADQDWRPAHDQWSFRFIAAHLAVGERECLRERVRQFASGTTPQFEWYDNSNRDFSQADLTDSLRVWAQTRAEVIEFVRSLPGEKLEATADHQSYGTITLLDYLKVWVEHDEEHLRHLEQMMAAYKSATR